MSHQSSATRPSCSSARAPPNFLSTFPTSARPSSRQVQGPSSSTNCHGASRPSETYPSLAPPLQIHSSASSYPLDLTMRSEARYAAILSSTLQPLDAAWPSLLSHQPEQPAHWNSFLGPQSTHVARPLPLQHTPGPYQPHPPSGSTANVRYPDPTIFHHRQSRAQSTQSIQEEQPLVTARTPEDLNHLDYLVRQLTLGPSSTRQGPTHHAHEHSVSSHSPTPQSVRPTSGHHTATHPLAIVDHHRTRHSPSVAIISLADDNLAPPYALHFNPHPTVPTSSYYPLIDPPLASTSTYQPDHLTLQNYSFAEQPTHCVGPPFNPSPYVPPAAISTSYPQQLPHPLYPVTHLGCPMFYAVNSLPDSQPRCAPQSSITIHEPPYSTNHVHQPPLRNPQRQISPGLRRPEQSHELHYQTQGMFSGSHNLSFKENTFIDNSTTSENFMKELLQHTIIGAEYDSSDRNPPPRCHPGSRLAVLGRCKAFIVECDGEEKMRWVVGPAGVGKSAIMQMVAEETPADASVFLSVNGRQDGTKTFMTIAYQLAAKYEHYRQFIQSEIARDPSLLRKLLPVQFDKFIVEPFIHPKLFDPSHRFVIIIDGLDECDNPLTQLQLLGLISEFCISYPTSPVVWFVASRPEPHITTFFTKTNVQPAYAKEEISIDSNEAGEDVQRYLRDELNEIKLAYPTLEHKREWPSELEFTKIATAAGGLFAYASTVVRYINDPYYGDPASQLNDVLAAIDAGPQDGTSRINHPLALLDALYDRIISKIPDSVMINTRKLLLVHLKDARCPQAHFRLHCNRLGLTEDAAYGAVRHLHAVVKVPEPNKADSGFLEYFHKSFEDFLFNPKRSRIFSYVRDEYDQLVVQSSLRIVKQVPLNFGGMARSERIACGWFGYLNVGRGFCDNISLSWPGDVRYLTTDYQMKRQLYTISMEKICSDFGYFNNFALNISCFHALTTRFTELDADFPIDAVRHSVFDKFRSELMDLGKLKQVPLPALDYAAIFGSIDIRFTGPVGMDVKYSDPWNPTCEHQRSMERDEQGRICWTTRFERSLYDFQAGVAHPDIPRFNIHTRKDSHQFNFPSRRLKCLHCSRRFATQLINNPDQLATVLVDATELCYVEWTFVDPDDCVSEWRYRFYHSGALKCVD